MASRGPLGGDAVVIGDRKVRAADILGRLPARARVLFAKVRTFAIVVVFPALPPFMRVPIRECSDGTWIARVSVVRVVLNIDTFRKRRDIQVILPDMTTQRYVHVSP